MQPDAERDPGHTEHFGRGLRGKPIPGDEPERLTIVLTECGKRRQHHGTLRHALTDLSRASLSAPLLRGANLAQSIARRS